MATRMSAADRREQVLQAATRAFARGGYAGTSTDAVAHEAGVSQPYVVRMFGTKLDLFLEVFLRAGERIDAVFAAVLAAADFDPDSEEDRERLGRAYADLLADRDLLLVLMHGFTAGGVEEAIASVGRDCMARIFATIQGTGWSDDDVRDFIAHGMLLNVLVAMRAPQHVDEGGPLAELTTACFGDDLDQIG